MNGLPGMNGAFPGVMPNAQAPVQTTVTSPQGAGGQPAVHICFSGVLTCSGCFPCDECAQVVKANVLVMALMEEQRVLTIDLQSAIQHGRAINLQLLAETFFRTVANAYRQLHTAMLSEPPDKRPFRIANISAIMEAAESWRALMLQQQAAQAAAQQPIAANPPAQNVAQPVASPAAPPPSNLSSVIPQTPTDFNKALEIKGDVITVQAEDSGARAAPAPSAPTPSGPAITKPLTEAEFKRAAPPANGSS